MRGNLTRRGRASWRLKYEAPADGSGRRRTLYKTLRGSKAEAQAEATKILASVSDGSHIDPSNETLAAFVTRWLHDWAAGNVGNRTYVRYETLLRRYVVAHLGHIPLQRLRAADVQRVCAEMAKAGLANRTQLHAVRVLRLVLKHAVQWGAIGRNVATLIDTPRVTNTEVEIPTSADIERIFAAANGMFHIIISVLLATGLRRGEVLALRWRNIDLERATLRVQEALEQTTRGGLVFKAPKTKHGRRLVTLPASTVTLLRAHRREQLERQVALGRGRLADDALVFPNWDDSPYLPTTLTQRWRRLMRRLGLQKLTLHSLRHAHASTLINSGIDILTISRRLGHGSAALTLNVYGHLIRDQHDRAAAAMDALLINRE